MNIIENNPYRQLGVYSNSPTRERVANHNRLNAFLQVGRKVDFPLDLTQYLPPINRTSETVAQANAALALPNDQLRYAQFWFIKVTPLDDIAFNHLLAGNMDAAIHIWERRECASSLQNRIVCALIRNEFASAVAYAERLYTQHSQAFVTAILGASSDNNAYPSLAFDFIDKLCDEAGAGTILPIVTDAQWKGHIAERQVPPLIAIIQSAIDVAKSSRGNGSTARYNAGVKLMNDTKEPLSQLRTFLSTDDLQYQTIADKLGLEILQCGIDYFNNSDEPDAAHKAMTLQSYAMNIVVGEMAKNRCKQNVDILKKIIDELPPAEVFAEDRAIREELKKYRQLPEKICHAVTLLNNTKPHLQTIKAKLGVENTYYLKVSTQVVNNALHNIIEEVNAVQEDETIEIEIGGRQVPISMLLDRENKIQQIRTVLQAAWNATKIMDTFEMESDFKNQRYNQNRSILKDMCEQQGISTSTYVPRPSVSQPRTTSIPHAPQKTSSSTKNKTNTTTTNSSYNSGCAIGIICIVVGAIIGAVVGGGGGAFFGALLGGLWGHLTSKKL